MTRSRLRVSVLAVCLTVLAGCAVATDVVNPGLLSALGFDPATIIPSPGRLIVAFVNDTSYATQFSVVTIPEAGEYDMGWSAVPANEKAFLAFDCPVAIVWPGALGADNSLVATAVTVITEGGVLEVPYVGSALQAGQDFVCGDVIEIRLYQTSTGQATEALGLEVRVRPGG